MPSTEQNFSDNILDLISNQENTIDNFNPITGSHHYVRMSVFDGDDNLISIYRSDKSWDGNSVYYEFDDGGSDVSGSYIPHNNFNLNSSTAISFPYIEDVQLPLYMGVSGSLHVKPNDTLVKDPNVDYDKGFYKLKFDFLVDVFDEMGIKNHNFDIPGSTLDSVYSPSFYLNQISVSRTEVRLLSRYYYGSEQLQLPYDEYFQNKFNSLDIGINNLYWNLTLPDTTNIPILSYAFDNVSLSSGTSLVIKLNSNIPGDINAPTSNFINISKEIYPTQTEEIFYIDDAPPGLDVTQLSADTTSTLVVQSYSNTNNQLQGYNDLMDMSSISSTDRSSILTSIFSESYGNINIDYRLYDNHAFFGSAELKIKNFYEKIKKIEDYAGEISSSLTGTSGFITESAVVSRRQLLFKNINDVISGFTPYERWLYYDTENTSSFPKAGYDYSTNPAISGSFNSTGSTDYNILSTNAEILGGYYGFDNVYKVSTIGDDVVISGSFNTSSAGNDIYNYWYTGSDKNWIFSGSSGDRIYSLGGSGDRDLLQVSGALVGNVNLDASPPTVTSYNQFKTNTKYLISFDVVDSYNAGQLLFRLGGKLENPASIAFDLDTGDAGDTKTGNINLTDDKFQDAPYNYLLINAGGSGTNWSGSIDNLSIVPSMDSDGRADIFTDVYNAEDFPFNHYNGKYYLSFLANWPVEPTWENYNASHSMEPIPASAFGGYVSQSDTTISQTSFGRYVYEASQSYWRYPNNTLSQSVSLTTGTSNETTSSEILVGSSITGSYSMDVLAGNNLYDGLRVYDNKSILPSGELFRIYHVTSSADNAPVTSSYLMDIKIFKEDSLWSGSLSDVVPFSNIYSVSSSIVQDWYSSAIDSASIYDRDNINSIWNNLPVYVRENDEEYILKKFMSMLGEHYDVIKNYIDNYVNIYSNSYDNYESVPFNFIDIIGENFGWNFINVNSLENLLDYYIGKNRQFNYKDLTYFIWRNILNNLVYIYKTKGTENSIRALLNCFGIPPEIITVDEAGGVIQSQTNPTVDFLNSGGIESTIGNISFNKKSKFLQLLNFNIYNNSFGIDWNTYKTGLTTGVEFIFSSFTSTNTQTLLDNSGSGDEEMWNLQIVPSGSSNVSASLRFQLNTSETGSNSINNTLNITSDYFSINTTKNDKLWNVLLQRESLTNNTGSYKLYLTNRVGDTIKYHYSSSLSVTSSFANDNFIGTGSLYSSGSNLIVGETLTGSIGEIRVISAPLTASKFYTHVFNHDSVAGNSRNDFLNVIHRYGFNDKYTSLSSNTIIKDIGSKVSGSSDKQLGNNFINPSIKKIYIDSFIFNSRTHDFSQYNQRKIIISKKNKFIGNELSPVKNNLISDDYFDEYGKRTRYASSRIDISISPSKIVDNLFQNYINDFYLGDLIGNPLDLTKSSYPDLVVIRRKILDQWDGNIDINMWIRNQMQYMFSNFWESLEQLLPARSLVISGILIQNDVLFRNKHPRDYEKSTGEWDSLGKYGSGINPHYFKPKYVLSDNVNLSNSILDLFFDDNIILENDYIVGGDIIDNNLSTVYDFNIDFKFSGDIDDNLNFDINLGNLLNITTGVIPINTSNNNLILSSVVNLKSYNNDTLYVKDFILSDNISTSNSIYNNVLLFDLKLLNDNFIIGNNVIGYNGYIELDAENEINLQSEFVDIYKNILKLDVENEINLKFDIFDNNIFDLDILPDFNLQSEFVDIYKNTLKLDVENEINLQSEYVDIYKNILKLDFENEINLKFDIFDNNIFDLDILPDFNLQSEFVDIYKNTLKLDVENEINLQSEYVDIYKNILKLDFENEINLKFDIFDNNIFDLDILPDFNLQSEFVGSIKSSLGLESSLNIYSILQELFGNNNPFINKQPFNYIYDWDSVNDGNSNSLRGGRIEDINNIGHFDFTKYTDPSYPNHKIKNKADEHSSGVSDSILNPAGGAYYETQVIFRTFEDTENINLRGRRRRTIYLNDLSVNVTHKKYASEIWDATNPDIFTNKVLHNSKILGRTSFMYIYGHWHDTRVRWGDDTNGYNWNDVDGLIHYPPNHYSKIINTTNMSIFNMTTNSGEPAGYYDPEGLISGETDAVIVRNVRGGKKTLKVTNATI